MTSIFVIGPNDKQMSRSLEEVHSTVPVVNTEYHTAIPCSQRAYADSICINCRSTRFLPCESLGWARLDLELCATSTCN